MGVYTCVCVCVCVCVCKKVWGTGGWGVLLGSVLLAFSKSTNGDTFINIECKITHL